MRVLRDQRATTMATPNDPKKPQPGKPADNKPADGAKPPDKPAMGKLDKPAAKPPAAGPGKPAAKPPAEKPKKPAEPVPAKSVGARVGGRKLGQVLIDLGFIDDDQLWEILDEGKNTGAPVGQVALQRGLITEAQLLQALAEQFGLRLLTAEELKPQAEALTLVPETMASVTKVVPLTYKDNVLTVAVADPVAGLQGLDTLRTFLGIQEVVACLAPATAINEVLGRCYQGKEESIMDIINALQDDEDLQVRRNESSI